MIASKQSKSILNSPDFFMEELTGSWKNFGPSIIKMDGQKCFGQPRFFQGRVDCSVEKIRIVNYRGRLKSDRQHPGSHLEMVFMVGFAF